MDTDSIVLVLSQDILKKPWLKIVLTLLAHARIIRVGM